MSVFSNCTFLDNSIAYGTYYLQFVSNVNPNSKSSVTYRTVNGVSNVTLTPETVTLFPGATRAFEGRVSTYSGNGYSVTSGASWSTDAPDYITFLTQGGMSANVKVAEDTPPGEYTIKYTSLFSETKYAESTITVPLPVTAVTVTPDQVILRQGGSTTLTSDVTVLDESVSKAVTWSVDAADEDYIYVDSQGGVTVDPDAPAGTYIVTAKSVVNPLVSGQSEITVTSVDGVEINERDQFIMVGSSANYTASVVVNGEEDESVTWSSNDPNAILIAKTGDSSAIIAISPTAEAKDYTITATSNADSRQSDSVTVSVYQVNSATLDYNNVTLNQREAAKLNATLNVTNGNNIIENDIEWLSSDSTAVSVDHAGNITVAADAPVGSYQITARSEHDTTKLATATINVTAITGITVTGEKNVLLPEEEMTLNHTVLGSTQDVDQDVVWTSSNGAAVSVDANGKIKAEANAPIGKYTITATSQVDDRVSQLFEIYVARVNAVTISPLDDPFLVAGSSLELQAFVDIGGNINAHITEDALWTSSNAAMVAVDADGTVTVLAGAELGDYTITATSLADTTKKESITLTVVEVDEVNVTPDVLVLHQGESDSLSASVEVNNGGQTPIVWNSNDIGVVTWSSNDPAVTVSDEGEVSVSADAEAKDYTITATSVKDSSVWGTATIKVTAITGVSVTPDSSVMLAGEEVQLTAIVEVAGDESAITGVDTSVIWESNNNNHVTVTTAGKVTIAANAEPGDYTITAISNVDGRQKGYAHIEVAGITSVAIAPVDDTNLIVGDSLELTANVSKVGTISDQVAWTSSNAAMVAVDSNGKVSVLPGVELGEYTITATSVSDTSKKDSIIITVIEVNEVTVTPTTFVLHQGESTSLSASVEVNNGGQSPLIWSSDDAGVVTWSSSDESAVTVDEDGYVTVSEDAEPIAYLITATSVKDGAVKGTATINVTAVTSVTVTPASVTLWEGIIDQTLAVEVSVVGNVDQSVVWSSSDETAIVVDQTGKLTVVEGAEAGLYTVTATSVVDDRKFAEATVYVAIINGVLINREQVGLQAGESITLHAIANIEGTVSNDIYWSTEDSEISVDQTGKVTVSPDAETGDYIVRAAVDVERSIYAEAVINVYEVTSISVTPQSAIVHQGNQTSFVATLEVVNGESVDGASDVVWSSSDENHKVTVDQTGKVTVAADAAPTNYTITARSARNPSINEEITITVTAVLSVGITPDKATISTGKEQALSVQVEVSGDVDQSVVWTSSDEAMVRVSEEGVVTVERNARAGKYTITATSVVDATKYAQVIITVPSPYIPTPDPNPVEPDPGTGSNPDGSTTNPDGGTSNPDGSTTNPDGGTTNPDGSGTAPNQGTTPTGPVLNNDKVDQEQIKQSILDKLEQSASTETPNEDESSSSAQRFTDVEGHWAYTTINQAVGLGFVNGYADGSFRPNASITRAEFATLVMNVFGIKAAGELPSFTDISDKHWAKSAIETLASAGVVNGYGNGSFAPDKEITREEMILIVSRIVNLNVLAKDTTKGKFTDLDQASSYAVNVIRSSAQAGIINGKGANTFDPQGQATRAEALTIIMNVLKLDADIAAILEQLK